MDDRVNSRVLVEHVVKGLLVGDVNLVEVGTAATEELNAVKSNLGGVVEAVYNNDIVAVLKESQGSKGANVAGATFNRSGELT